MPAINVNERRERLIQALAAMGEGWHTRIAIAAHLHKQALNPTEIILLETLVAAGEIERTAVPTINPPIQAWAYRVKGGDAGE